MTAHSNSGHGTGSHGHADGHSSGAKDHNIVDDHRARVNGGIKKVFVFVFCVFMAFATKRCYKEQAVAQAQSPRSFLPPIAAEKPPEPVFDETPTSLTADYAFAVEARDSIRMKIPGIRGVITHDPNRACVVIPKGANRDKGEVAFWSAADSANGHVKFRLYPLTKGDCSKLR